jgi:hypothetical protein
MQIICDIPLDENSPENVKILLETLARIWGRSLRRRPLPPLYNSGVRYQREPNAGLFEEWKSPAQCFEAGWGDCDDLTLWRAAELIAAGEAATVSVKGQPLPTGWKMHVRVRRASGVIEDPSILVDQLRI